MSRGPRHERQIARVALGRVEAKRLPAGRARAGSGVLKLPPLRRHVERALPVDRHGAGEHEGGQEAAVLGVLAGPAAAIITESSRARLPGIRTNRPPYNATKGLLERAVALPYEAVWTALLQIFCAVFSKAVVANSRGPSK